MIEVASHLPLERHAAHRSPLHQPSALGARSQTQTANTRGTIDPASTSAVAAGRPRSSTNHIPQSTGSAETEHARYISTFTNTAKTGDPAPPTCHTHMPRAPSDTACVIRAADSTTPCGTTGRSTTAWDPHHHHLHHPTATAIASRNGMKIPYFFD